MISKFIIGIINIQNKPKKRSVRLARNFKQNDINDNDVNDTCKAAYDYVPMSVGIKWLTKNILEKREYYG
jgi:hypothetical protein